MKTAIYLPDALFEDGEKLAKKLGISRSELYTRALKKYLTTENKKYITDTLNQVYSQEDSRLDPVVAKLQSTSIVHEKW